MEFGVVSVSSLLFVQSRVRRMVSVCVAMDHRAAAMLSTSQVRDGRDNKSPAVQSTGAQTAMPPVPRGAWKAFMHGSMRGHWAAAAAVCTSRSHFAAGAAGAHPAKAFPASLPTGEGRVRPPAVPFISGGRATLDSEGRAMLGSEGRAMLDSEGRATLDSGGRATPDSGGRATPLE